MEKDTRPYTLAWTISIVALLNSVVAVFVIVVPITVNLFTPKNSDLIYSIQASADRSIGLLVSNSGTRAGTVSGASLSGKIGDEEINGLELQVAELGSAAIVSPSETRLFAVTVLKPVPGVSTFDVLPCGASVALSIDVRSTDFRGQRHTDHLPINCAEQRDFLSSLPEMR
ncbi:hypothetical protein X760_31670 [Mesorhizobium sp. LSHC422A00]|uniref:hypothetical protein n=1 Tax=Mesorhizobium sp. LSHC422A00 TaxID=1287294 RepID=UPI0003CEE718|nr:hypothetical protein [Mesorhizobium sp. LSHC422A00]ESX50802.1 hypothetical protein X760_31670 [Mesorhizobium sp. LSHC422A00]